MSKKSPMGIITARDEYNRVQDAVFFNFDFNKASALGSCAMCYTCEFVDSGARTITLSGLHFDPATVTRRIRW